MDDAFQHSAIQHAESLFQAFGAGSSISAAEYFFNGGAHCGFNGHIALAVAFCNIDPFFS